MTCETPFVPTHPSSASASSTFEGSIMDNNPKADSSGLKCDLVLVRLSLFPMIWSSGCEDLYLNVYLDWASGVGSTSGLSSDSIVWSGSEVSSGTCISTKLSPCYRV